MRQVEPEEEILLPLVSQHMVVVVEQQMQMRPL
jgi:hypothetical protein